MSPHSPETSRATLELVTFNVWEGQPLRRLRGNLNALVRDTDQPHVLCLQEARRLTGSIPDYRRVGAEHLGGDESRSTVLLVREDVKVVRTFALDAGGPDWYGPKHGRAHDPRKFPGIVLEHGIRWDVLGVHRTSLKWAPAAWAAEDRVLEAWFDRHERHTPHRPQVILADWNGRRSDPQPLAISGLAKRVDARLVMNGIDGFMVRNCAPVRGSVAKLEGKYGSDAHRPVTVTLRAER